MKYRIFALPLTILVFGICSCMNRDNEDQTEYFETMAVVTSTGFSPSFLTDYGFTLNCSNVLASDTLFNSGERVFVQFSYGDTIGHAPKVYPINLTNYWRVTVKDFVSLEPDSVDLFANMELHSVYDFRFSGNYLNMIFRTFYARSFPNACELVRMEERENNTPQDTVPSLYFELRHNVVSVNASICNLEMYSFDLSPLNEEFPSATLFKVNLKWIEAGTSGSHSYNFEYEPYNAPEETIVSINRRLMLPVSGSVEPFVF